MAEEQKTHMHVLEDGTVVEHSHGEHVHHHSHAHTKAVLNRMSRAIEIGRASCRERVLRLV